MSLYHLDVQWSQYLQGLSHIRDSIHLRRLGGQDPLFEFRKLAIELFEKMDKTIETNVLKDFNGIKITDDSIHRVQNTYKTPSSTWTYLIDDKSFDDTLGLQFLNNIGLSLGVLIVWPMMVLIALYKKLFKPDIK